tara:strand:+ start:229 stop:1020 length:792 start_codon:yes stop_codon:yes gene_type:complete
MCAPDPNAGIRYQAKQEWRKKNQQYQSESLKYWNREAAAKQRSQGLAKGFSRAKSDIYSKALYVLGKGRKNTENLMRKRAAISRYDQKRGVSRASRYMSNKYKEILAAQSQIESTLNTTFGRNMDIQYQGIERQYMNLKAKNREKLGVRPEYGAPVMMPPKDTQGQMFNTLSMGISAVGAVAGLVGLFGGSDRRLKENIEEVGKSPDGHTIYEWNYKTNKHSRYRGAIAQDVVKRNPMAVGIMPNGLLGIYYDKIDVNMEKIS